ncbi:MAG: ADP-ribosylglycohydrolase family protein [Planctomycetaceae bacterium]|nr:ADP-ribosylglycohydrolase family protein [Planctomycetaceae bacterium]
MSKNARPDHEERMERARLSLTGLSVGDAFGEQFFFREAWAVGPEFRQIPPSPWRFTDDTVMAIGLMAVLEACEEVEQDELADAFATRYQRDPGRGYGATAHTILRQICLGTPWRQASAAAFRGEGSMGNGSAMRVGPLGAYFADDLDKVASQARLSAEVTHLNAEGIAIAVAAAWAWRWNASGRSEPASALFKTVLSLVPRSSTWRGIELASVTPLDTWEFEAAESLGDGSNVTCPDTVPYCLWTAARHLDDYREALWTAVKVGGDIDTNAAIVGGIVSLAVGVPGIPAEWIRAREPLW